LLKKARGNGDIGKKLAFLCAILDNMLMLVRMRGASALKTNNCKITVPRVGAQQQKITS
jgi:hypothetical protein